MFEHCPLQEPVHLFFPVWNTEVHRMMQLIDGTRRHLDLAVARLAVLQILDVPSFKCEALQVGQLWRTADFNEREVCRKLPKPFEVARKLQVTVRRSINVDRAKNEDLLRCAGVRSLGNSLAATDGRDLIVTESNVVLEIGLQVRIGLRKAGRGGSRKNNEQQSVRQHSTHGVLRIPCKSYLSLHAFEFNSANIAEVPQRIFTTHGNRFNLLCR